MEKYLRVTMTDGSKWDIPAHVIAANRASYYAKKDTGTSGGEEYDRVYKEEYEYTMNDKHELLDWAINNMNWEDVAEYAVLVVPTTIDFQEGWMNGPKEIIQK